uniref:Conserved oligomeric Golgi complex subunit 2 n=1 Tax=Saccoglossus kowalevskii TaxID=10224 RepID=A0ABM0MBR9_SACKO|nr:PREDICTED: conserved oligomeric Golgi complex subunit 2-like [Saccoglossus kowalevskii]
MDNDPINLTITSAPTSLCFDKNAFMQVDFDVDQFVAECRRHVPLETLRDDLDTYFKSLKSAMVELINKDYADFVNLSSNLVGMDKAINNLSVPLGQLREEVLAVRNSMTDAMQVVEKKLIARTEIRKKKATLQRLQNIIQSVDKMEKILQIQKPGEGMEHVSHSELTGQLIERVASEFNQLQFYVTQSKGLPLVENIRPRIAVITTTLQMSLENSFEDSLETGNLPVLRQCLRTYAIIDKTKDAEMLFRTLVVRPFMEEVISEQYILNNPQGLQGMYNKIVEFIPKHCQHIRAVTSPIHSGGSQDVVRGYDFLVNAVWPEIVSCIEARTPSIFAPGNPDVFHQKYMLSMDFLCAFERHCGSQASVKRLRAHSSYNTYMSKWSLPVYFQIRFQEIAGAFESSLMTPFNVVQEDCEFNLAVCSTLWQSLKSCWSDQVYISALCHRFWKLTLQLLSRCSIWLQEICEKELPELLSNEIQPKLAALNFKNIAVIEEALNEGREALIVPIPAIINYVIKEIHSQCVVHFKAVNDIPRLYRRTNREIPSKASVYVDNIIKPLQLFLEENGEKIKTDRRGELLSGILTLLTQEYFGVTSDVLDSVRKMEESLKKLKMRKVTSVSNFSANGMSDDDKIRLQLALDVRQFAEEMDNLGIKSSDIPKYDSLSELVKNAATHS